MFRPADPAGLPGWFVVLADLPAAGPIADRLRDAAGHVLAHPSGRPWLLGCWPERSLTVGAAGRGTTAVAVLGEHRGDPAEAELAARQLDATGRLGADVCRMAGSYHVIGRRGGEVHVRAGITEVRRVFFIRGSVPVAGDRADVLAGLLGAAPDPELLALHLLDPQTLYPLAGRPVWRGVEAVLPGYALRADGSGHIRQDRWWHPPNPVIALAEGAAVLRDALTGAVRARTAGHPVVTCDLGGLDSTAVCGVAATGGGARVVAYTVDVHDPAADDVRYGRLTSRALGIEHYVIPAERMPLSYQGLTGPAEPWDEPCFTTVDRSRWRMLMRLAVDRGSTVHLTGIGGDELLYGSPAHLQTLLRRRPSYAWQQLRGFAAKYRWPRGEMLRQLADSRPYPGWLRGVAADLTAPPPALRSPLLGWGSPPRLPPWTTPAAAQAVRDLIDAAAAGATPLAATRGLHRELEAVRSLSRAARQLRQMAAGLGLDYAVPYYDDQVVEAALRIDPVDRITPWRYKPIIVEAMRGVVPEVSRCRETKANAMVEEETGQREHRGDLLALCEDSRLARLGLIDAAAFRAACAGRAGPGLQIGVLHQTLACEVWLRSLENSAVTTPGGTR